MFGSPETTPGGRALKFYTSVRVDVRKISALKDGDANIGIRMKVKVVKNKVAPPFRQTEFDLLEECGINVEGDVLDMALEDRIIDRSGSWLTYGDHKLGQGREKARQFLRENPKVLEELRRKVIDSRGVHGMPVDPGAKPDPEEDEEPEE
jgi:recombination protein RecA